MVKKKSDKCNGGCPIEAALELIGGKWKVVILHNLLKQKTLRFGELKKNLPSVTQRMLTKQLREMEQDKIVTREVFLEVPPKVEYTLTEFGESLKDVVKALEVWGKKNAR